MLFLNVMILQRNHAGNHAGNHTGNHAGNHETQHVNFVQSSPKSHAL